jgi:hypothetical protein
MKILKQSYFSLMILALSMFEAGAQEKTNYRYTDGSELTVSGRSPTVDKDLYLRIDSADAIQLPKKVQELATNSAGINLMFQTDSKSIKVKWTLAKLNTLWNMTSVAVNGLDLYGWNGKSWQYVSSARPSSETNEATFISGLDGKLRHYKLYLPLYSQLKKIAIGVEEGSAIGPAGKGFSGGRKVVIYGSSITQGASASRPGMAYPSIISRNLPVEIFNLGFSGSGKMELQVADILAKMPADLYVLDCVPNPTAKEIHERAIPLIKRLRALQPNVPILMVESIYREAGNWDNKVREEVLSQNREFREAYNQLIAEKYKSIYYLSGKDLMGKDHEATIDGTHLTDLGQLRIAKQVGVKIAEILELKTSFSGNRE